MLKQGKLLFSDCQHFQKKNNLVQLTSASSLFLRISSMCALYSYCLCNRISSICSVRVIFFAGAEISGLCLLRSSSCVFLRCSCFILLLLRKTSVNNNKLLLLLTYRASPKFNKRWCTGSMLPFVLLVEGLNSSSLNATSSKLNEMTLKYRKQLPHVNIWYLS